MDVVHKIGRRKTAVARVYLSEGKGNITVNKKDFRLFYYCYSSIQSRASLNVNR